MSNVVFDASALLALLNQEAGQEIVEEHLHRAIMSTVNFSEVCAVLASTGMPIIEARQIISELIPETFSFDHQQAVTTAQLRQITKSQGLSFGDRACIALAKLKNFPVLTADKVWKKIDCGVNILLIR